MRRDGSLLQLEISIKAHTTILENSPNKNMLNQRRVTRHKVSYGYRRTGFPKKIMSREGEIIGYTCVSGRPTLRKNQDVKEII
jgi:hypothetical protein